MIDSSHISIRNSLDARVLCYELNQIFINCTIRYSSVVNIFSNKKNYKQVKKKLVLKSLT
jgi:hypothetical protein